MGKSWCVVEFSDGLQIVPQIWIDGDKCCWPSTINSQKLFERLVRSCAAPDVSWIHYSVRILGVYDSYELAIPKLKLAETQSDLNTEDEDSNRKSRAIRKKLILSSSDDDISEEEGYGVPVYPDVPKTKAILDVPKTKAILDLPKPKLLLGNLKTNMCSQRPMLSQTSSSDSDAYHNLDVDDTLVNQLSTDCHRCPCSFDKEYKKKIDNDLNELKHQLKLVLQMLREQCRPNNEHQNENIEHFDNLNEKLPIKTEEHLFTWEKNLVSKDEQKKMISYLANIGGHDVNTIVKHILRRLFTDDVACLYNWEGKKGKKMFSSLILSDCIKKASAQSPNFKGTEQDIILAIKNWMRHASARLKTSNHKKNPENEQE